MARTGRATEPGRTPRRVAVGAVVAVAALVLGLLIVRTDGYAATSVQPDPQSVWVTNAADLLVGRVNTQIDELESAALLDGADTDVLQDGRSVVVVDAAAHRVRSLDVASVSLGPPVPIPAAASVALAGTRLAVADRTTGAIRVVPVAEMAEGSFTTAAAAVTARPGVTLAGSADGTVAAVAPGGDAALLLAPGATAPRRIHLGATLTGAHRTDAAGTAPTPPTTPAEGTPPTGAAPGELAITLVGDAPVVLDAAAHRIVTPERAIALPAGQRAVLQQPGPESDAVLVETASALLRIPLDGSQIQRFDSGVTGSPTAPVWLGGCAHAAWSGERPTYLRWCGSTPDIRPIPRAGSGTGTGTGTGGIVFRVNGGTIVLNDIATGNVWVADRSMVLINDWDQVAPRKAGNSDDQAQNSGESQATTLTLSRTDCSSAAAPPVAKPDTFGVRAGRPTILPVMTNDSVSDCSVSRIASVSALPPDLGTVTVVDGGTALQVVTDAAASGQLPPVTYQLSDGRRHTASAVVSIHIVPEGVDAPPAKVRDSATVVARGGTATTNVLQDWISPDGDALYLTAARGQASDETVDFTPDGEITVRDSGTGAPGKHTVAFTVSDGTDSAQGTLTVQVLATADVIPVPSPVYARTTIGTPVTVHPLATVLSIGPDPLRLTSVTPAARQPGLSAVPDSGDGTVTITAAQPGTYYLSFQVASGSQTASGVVRVDVAAPADDPTPRTVVDTAYLPQGGTTRVDLVANDVAPSGGVLAVQQISVDDGSPLVVTMADMHIATISASTALPPAGVWFSYTVIGSGPPATGWVHVIGVPPDTGQAPVATPIWLTVRAGDAATVSVTGAGGGSAGGATGAAGAARDPGGSPLTVAPFDPLPAGSGLLFAAGADIRYLAPAGGPVAPIDTTYTVTNAQGLSDSAALHIRVVPTGTNHPPRTPPVTTARVFAGDTVAIALPLDGIDPDGDWAIATAIAAKPAAGTATVTGPEAITYTAPDRPGDVSLEYTVSDPFGAHSTGAVTVGVVARPDTVQPPTAPDLTATVAPRGTSTVDVLDAVSDPGGSTVGFADPGLAGPKGAGVRGRIDGNAVIISAGPAATVVPLTYTVQNAAGLTASGTITVTVSPDAPKVPPVAHDAYVTESMVSADGRTAVVNLSGLVSDPGGSPDDLALRIPAVDGGAATAVPPLSVRVALTGGRQVLAYQVQGGAGLTASAFIVVPGRNELVPAGGGQGAARASAVSPPGGAPPTLGAAAPPSASSAAQAGRSRTATAPATTRSTVPTTGPSTAPPTPVVSEIQARVQAGGTAVVRLTGMVQGADRYRTLTFSGLGGGGHGITGMLRGSVLTVTAAPQVAAGTTTDLTVRVADGVHPPVTGTIAVTVIATTTPRPTVPSRQVTAKQGKPVTVDMLSGATNALASRGPLRLTAATLTGGNATVRFQPGGAVTVTPAADETGSVTVLVTAVDPANRHASGTLTVTVLGRPDPPRTVAVAGTGDRTVTLTWSAPDDHGSAISQYVVEATGVTFDCGTSTRCTVTGLTNGQPYQFAVRARNGVGTSDPSARVGATPDVAPGAPGRPTATVGDRMLTFTWTAPHNDGSPIDHYQVTINPAPTQGSDTLTTTTTSVRIDNLQNGTPYTLTVVAVNASGAASPASTSDPATPMTAPGAPGRPQLTFDQGAGAIDVAWTAPASDGGDAHPTYTVHWSATDGAGSGTVDAKTARTATITGVQLGATYTVWVVAANPAGASPGGTRATITPTTAPEQVTGLAASPTGTGGTVSLAWRAPADGGAAITGYQVRYRQGSGSYGSWAGTGSAATSKAVTGLANGSTYTFQVRACNGASSCGAESAGAPANPYSPPGKIDNLSAYGTGTSGQVKAIWSAPANGGRAIATYQYRYKKGSGSYTGWKNSPTGTATSMTLGGFSDGTGYTFQVRAVTTARSGDPSGGSHTGPASNADGATPCRPPNQMAAPTGTNITQSSITLHWSAPFNGGRAISKYQYRIGSGSWRDAGSGTSRTVTGLKSGTSYSFRVRACNAVGCGTASTARSIKTKPAPSVSLVHGSPISNSQCNVDCYYFKIKYANLKAGSYKVTIYLSGKVFRTYQWSLGSSGSKQATSYAGRNPSRTAKVTLVGPSGTVTSPTRTWP